MNYQPLLRDYRQMVRIVRNKDNSATSFNLGNAYGKKSKDFSDIFANDGVTPTELQMRTLNEMNLPSTSPRRPDAPAKEGLLSNREGSTLFHDLNTTSKDYLNALGGSNGVRRSDGLPGTKLRTQLGKDALATKVYNQSLTNTSTHLPATTTATNKKQTHSLKPTSEVKSESSSFNVFK